MPGWLLALLGGGVTTLAAAGLAVWQWMRARNAEGQLAPVRALAASNADARQAQQERADRAEMALAEAAVRHAEVVDRHARAVTQAREDNFDLQKKLEHVVYLAKGNPDVVAFARSDADARLSGSPDPAPGPRGPAAGRGAGPAVPHPAGPGGGPGGERR